MKPAPSLWLLIVAGTGLLLFPADLLALDPAKSVFQYNCRNWTRQSGGLPVNGIRDIAQTRDGYIWLASQKGPIRFDGMEFTLIDIPVHHLYRHQNVSCLEASGGGGFWFGSDGSAFAFFNGQTNFQTLEGQPWITPNMNVRALHEAADGSLWIGYNAGVVRKTRDGQGDFYWTNGLLVTAIYEDPLHRVWLGTTQDGLHYWEAGELKQFPDRSLAKDTVFAIVLDRQERLWVGTQLGLRCYDTNFRQIALPYYIAETRALLVDRQGALWIGTSGQGVGRFYNETLTFLNKTNGLAHDFVNALLEDREGSLWVATREGISQLSDVKFPIVSANEGIAPGAPHGVSASPNGGLWITTSGGVSWYDGRTARNYSTAEGLSLGYIKRAFESSKGDVYLLNGGRAIEILTDNRIVARYQNKDWPTAIAEDAEGVVVSVGGNLFRVSPSDYVPYAFPDGQEPPFYWIRNLHGCRDGSLLVASVNGIFRIRGSSVEHWTPEHGLSGNDILWVSEDEDGTIWAGMPTGMARIKDGEVRCISRENGLADNHIFAIVPDNLQGLWLHSTRGILHVGKQNISDFLNGTISRIDCATYDGLEMVKSIDTTEIEYTGCRTTDGRIWFANPQGVTMIDPSNLPTNRIAPPVHIQRVHANGQDLAISGSNSIPGRGELEFFYTALSYVAPQKVRFRYRLEGYDTGWVDAGTRRSAFYTNLKPGNYRFNVQACNADGVWNTAGAAINVTLPPHFYQRPAFIAAAAVAGLLLVAAGYRWSLGQYRQRQRKLQDANVQLEARISERTRELAEQRNLLRTLIDHLPDNVFVKDTNSRIILDNVAHARNLGANSPEEAAGKSDFDFFPRELAEKFFADEQAILASGEAFNGEETSINRQTGQRRWSRTTKVPLRDAQGKIIGIAGINRDITERKQWEEKLEILHKQLLDASRRAGMAEVATSVLHNVGNVLNSVNVSATMVEDRLRSSETANLAKVVALLQAHRDDLAAFLAHDEKGRKLIPYLELLVEHLNSEKSGLLKEIHLLVKNVEHIKEIVAMQQAYARVAGVTEIIQPAELFEDALRMHQAAFERHGIKLKREFADVPAIIVDRHKVIQILVNLLQNAKYACDETQSGNRRVIVRLSVPTEGRVRFEVIDNGIGIAPENLSRIFNHGFTTRRNGHGFGLHSGALSAREMGGSLTAFSAGTNQGATFALELPVEHKPEPQEKKADFQTRMLRASPNLSNAEPSPVQAAVTS